MNELQTRTNGGVDQADGFVSPVASQDKSTFSTLAIFATCASVGSSSPRSQLQAVDGWTPTNRANSHCFTAAASRASRMRSPTDLRLDMMSKLWRSRLAVNSKFGPSLTGL